MPSGSRLVNRNVVGEKGRTSMRLEPELWDALREIGRREQADIGTIIRQVEARGRPQPGGGEADRAGGRTSAIRVFIVQYFRKVAEVKPDECGKGPPYRGNPGYENRPT
jgi:predicted DNA-binding ribbon-helix-helix protein